jgi:hypothetical protein
MNIIEFKQWECIIEKSHYTNGRTALILFNANEEKEGGHIIYPPGTMQIAVATVNLPDVDLAPDEVIIKNWSENEGMLETLHNEDIIGPVLRIVKTGFVEAYVCQLLINNHARI